ncbi:hypothetical protein [Streptomyces sp. MZ04]|uniref:hypothetical protein n=1 Tax=Streptomyces sp. MZ04 TaxID=2559236 RepID=UPI00107EA145|nr:hypothetical protein [Streptomyces sp. MZ04]TGB00872.1 hypothetical protein E2651_28225 [Streptomyces sp. MZ04]
MSNSDTTHAPHPTPEPEPLANLTGAPATIYTELVASPGATGAELALAAGLGRSTAGKALVALEEQGLAVRTPGGHEGARRTPDRWSPAPPPTHEEEQTPTAETSEASARDTDTGTAAPASPSVTTAGDAAHGDATDTAVAGADSTGAAEARGEGRDGETPATAPRESEDPDEPKAMTTTPGGQRVRLAPGALRQLVIDHLEAHPAEAFTATKISRVIEKSSGAIANALVTLTKQGITEQVTEQPRTYRLAGSGAAETE